MLKVQTEAAEETATKTAEEWNRRNIKTAGEGENSWISNTIWPYYFLYKCFQFML